MREIKYQVFNLDTKKMYQVGAMDWDGNGEVITVHCVDGPKLYQRLERDGRKFVLREYTGLKDKNGKMIFEGDVIKNGQGQIVQVLFGENPVTHIVGFYNKRIPSSPEIKEPIGNRKEYEVIGNIYENPELLNEQNNEQ